MITRQLLLVLMLLSVSSYARATYYYSVQAADYIYNPGAAVPTWNIGDSVGAWQSADSSIGCRLNMSRETKPVICLLSGGEISYEMPKAPLRDEFGENVPGQVFELIISKHINSAISHVGFKLNLSKIGLSPAVNGKQGERLSEIQITVKGAGVNVPLFVQPINEQSTEVLYDFPETENIGGIDVDIKIRVVARNLPAPDETPIRVSNIEFGNDSNFDLSISNPKLEQPLGVPAKLDSSGLPILTPGHVAYLIVDASARNIPPSVGAPAVFIKFYNGTTSEVYPLTLFANGPVRVPLTFAPVDSISPQSINVTMSSTLSGQEPNKANNGVSQRFVTQLPAKIEIADVKIGQVVWEPSSYGSIDVSIVRGKSFGLKVSLATQGIDESTRGTIALSTTIDGIKKTSHPVDVQELLKNKGELTLPDLVNRLETTGAKDILVELTPSSDLVLGEAPLAFHKEIKVVSTQNLSLGLYSVMSICVSAPCYQSPPAPKAQLSFGYELSAFMPVPDNGVTLSDAGSIAGSQDFRILRGEGETNPVSEGIKYDIATLKYAKRNRQSQWYSRAIGIVSDNYFITHQRFEPNLVGIAHGGAALVAHFTKSTIGHELVHTLVPRSLVPCNEDYVDCEKKDYPAIDGYDATDNGMRSELDGVKSIMDLNAEWSAVWVDRLRYSIMLAALQKPLRDPRVIIMSGLLKNDGSFRLLNSAIREAGNLDESDGSDIQIQTISTNGNVTNTLSLEADFTLTAEYSDAESAQKFGTVKKVNEIPIAFAVPFDVGAEAIGITLAGKKPNMVDPYGLSLREAINSIPVSALKFLPQLTKAALNEEAKLAQIAFTKRKNTEALVLVNLILAEVKSLTRDFNSGESGYTKTDVIKLLDHTIDSLKLRIKAGRK